MNKYSVAALLAVYLIAVNKAATVPDRDTFIKFVHAAIEDCYEDDAKTIKVEATAASFESLVTSDPNPPHATKCMRFCVMRAHNLYNDDNTLNINHVQELFKSVYTDYMDENKIKIVGETAKHCLMNASTEDRCEKSHDLTMCMISKLAEQGIDIKKI